jgi:hypothetical protein
VSRIVPLSDVLNLKREQTKRGLGAVVIESGPPLPNRSTLLPWGCRYHVMQIKTPPGMPQPNTVWNAVAAFEHDYRDEAGKKIHSYLCRRCRLELLLRQVTGLLGTSPDCPEEVPLVRSGP